MKTCERCGRRPAPTDEYGNPVPSSVEDRCLGECVAELTCIHAARGLCPACQEECDEDAAAYREFGDHPAGLARWRALQDELRAELEHALVFEDPLNNLPF